MINYMIWMFQGREILHICGYAIKGFHASKHPVWLKYVKSQSTKEQYESKHSIWLSTWGSFHVCKSFTKIFRRKNKSEYISGLCLNLLVVSIWSNMFNTIGYLHHSLQTQCTLCLDMSDLGRICPTLVERFWKFDLVSTIAGNYNFSSPCD
jgi:hypothetical protein